MTDIQRIEELAKRLRKAGVTHFTNGAFGITLLAYEEHQEQKPQPGGDGAIAEDLQSEDEKPKIRKDGLTAEEQRELYGREMP
jgi:hypothetical protein